MPPKYKSGKRAKTNVREKPKGESQVKQHEKKTEKNLDNLDALDEQTIDFNQLLNLEFQKLSREYREIEDDRHAIAGKKHSAKSKQKRTIELLHTEKNNLDANLSNILAPCWEAKDEQARTNIVQIMEEWDEGSEELKTVLLEIRQIRERVQKIVKQLVIQKLHVQHIFGLALTLPQVEKKQRILENRLHLLTQKCDTKMYENKKLKVQMDQILKYRSGSFKRLEELKMKIAAIRSFNNEIVAQCCGAYNQRDGLKQRIRNIREKDARETKMYLSDIVEFERQLNLDKWNYQFAVHKNVYRNMGESEEQRQSRKLWLKYKEQVDLLSSYKYSTETILRQTKQKSMDQLLQYYNEREQRNFAKFLHLSDTNYETMKAKEDVEVLVAQVDDLKVNVDLEKKKNQDKIDEWDENIRKRREELEQLQKQGEEIQTKLKDTHKLIEYLFQVAGCEYTGIQMFLGTKEEAVTSQNVRFFMKSIENSIQEMINTNNEYEARKALESKQVTLGPTTIKGHKSSKNKGLGGPYIPNVLITGQLDDNDDNTDSKDKTKETKPCTYEELKKEITEQFRLQQEAEADQLTINLGSSVSSVHSKSVGINTTATAAKVETNQKMTSQHDPKLGSFHENHSDIVKSKEESEEEDIENEVEESEQVEESGSNQASAAVDTQRQSDSDMK